MAYRYSDTLKWQDEWFVDLTSTEKLLFMYLCDNCDIAGFFELSYRKISFDLGVGDDKIKGAVKGLNRNVFVSDDEKCVLVKNFIRHQKNLPLNPENKAHRGILKRIEVYLPKFTKVVLDYKEGYLCKGASKPLPSPPVINTVIANKQTILLREGDFKKSLLPFTKYSTNPEGIYPKEMVKEFFEYWKEPNKSQTKMRYEMEKTWDVKLRLNRWAGNNFGSKNGHVVKEPSKYTQAPEPVRHG